MYIGTAADMFPDADIVEYSGDIIIRQSNWKWLIGYLPCGFNQYKLFID